MKVCSHLADGEPEVQEGPGGSVGYLVVCTLLNSSFKINPEYQHPPPPTSHSLLLKRTSLKHLPPVFFAKLLPLPETLPPSICLVKFNPSFKAQLRCHFSPWLEFISPSRALLGLALSLVTSPRATGLASQILTFLPCARAL